MLTTAVEDALRADPDDPAAWHAYSDVLLERGDARGTLIRLEQRLTRVRPADRPALEREIADLVTAHGGDWDDALPATASVLTRRHGFPTGVSVAWSDEVGADVEQALATRFVTTLRITQTLTDDDDDDEDYWDGESEDDGPGRLDVRPLADVDLGRPAALDLSYLDLGADGAETLAAALRTGRLRALDLRYCRVGDDGLKALAASPHLAGLRRLHLHRNRVTADGVRHLHWFPALTELDLRYNTIGATGAEALAAAPFAAHLTRLGLYRCDVGDDGARLLAQATTLPATIRSIWRCQ